MVQWKCNNTLEYEKIDEKKIWHNMEFHHFGLILSALFGLIAVLMSWYLIWRHCTHYLKPWQQRHIIRVLFMVPTYSIVSFLSYLFYRHAVYFEVIYQCYEAFAIASFFALLCSYIGPDLHNQKDYFRTIRPIGWVWPLSWFKRCFGGERGWVRTPRSGLTWFNIIWLGVFQYCFVRVFMTMVALFTQAVGRYCQESLSPIFAHIWVMVIEGLCVSVAMYCLIQFYVQIRNDLAEHSPLLKVAAIKLVIFLSFWQTLLISFLTSAGAIKPSDKLQTPDIKIGIPSMLLCIEMAFFSIFHLWAFPWRVYDIRRSEIVAAESAPGFLPDPKTAYSGGPFGTKALADAFNPWDMVKNIGRGFKWFAVGRKRRMEDISYKNSRANTGLEPTRNQLTAFDNTAGNNSLDEGPQPYLGAGSAVNKSGRYTPILHNAADDDDADHLLTHAQTNPRDPSPNPPTYPRPMERLSHANTNSSNGDIGTMGIYDPPPPSKAAPLYPSSHSRNSSTTHNNLPYPSSPRLDSQQSLDTSSHSTTSTANTTSTSARRVTPTTIPPDPYPLGPPGRRSYEEGGVEEWDLWGAGAGEGRGESERELGGGHGVGDNRF
ncbi:hypothetical protein ACLMJK_003077 [Lecanora helva]